MAIREGAWDCPVCGRKKNRGPDKFCGGCGAPRGPEVKFYLPDDAPEVVEAEALKRAQAGPDWICPYCNADNPATNAFCSGCGAARDGAKQREVVEHRLDAPPPPPPAPPAPPSSGKVKKGCGIVLLGLALVFFLTWFFGRPQETTLTVTGHHWQRTVAVEELRKVTEQAWEGEVPGSASLLGSSREVHHVDHIQTGTRTATRTVSERVQTGTEHVKVGTRDLGNGYFEDVYEDRPVYENRSHEETYQEPVYVDRPVYRNRVRYQIEKWVPDPEAKSEGQDLAPAWPDIAAGPRRRDAGRKELYEVLFQTAKGKPAVYQAPNEQVWRSFEEGRTYKGKVQGEKVVEVEGG